MVLWRLRYKLSLRDLPEIFAVRGIVFSHEAGLENARVTYAARRSSVVASRSPSPPPITCGHGREMWCRRARAFPYYGTEIGPVLKC